VAAVGAPQPETASASVSVAMATPSARAPRIRRPLSFPGGIEPRPLL
jgi:hypothetical protein